MKVPVGGRQAARLVGVFVLGLMAGSASYFAGIRAAASGRVLPRVTVLGLPVGGLEAKALRERLATLAPRVEALNGQVWVKDRVYGLSARSVGLSLDVDATLTRVLDEGRTGPATAQVAWFVARAASPAEVPVAVRFDAARLQAQLDALERSALGEPAVEGAVTYTDHVEVTLPRPGLAVTRDGIERLLEAALVGRRDGVELPVRTSTPKLTSAEVQRAAQDAARLIEPITLRAAEGDAALTFTTADLGRALRSVIETNPAPHLTVTLEPDALREALDRARPRLSQPARDATFTVGPNHDITLVPSELGTRLDDAAILDRVLQLARTGERTGELTLRRDVTPQLTTEQAEALHVRALVSRYTTPFPCCEARVKNIERMAALVNGSIVRPGESYSLNAVSGPRTAANGFVAGPTIVEGEMEMTVGGGVSQFATTLFNAAFDGGYEIIQRQPHTYWFPRYPEGHDATLGFPLPDLVFRNDTEAAIFIKTEVGRTFVRVELYGDNGGRRVERKVSPRFDLVKPETVLEPNPDLRPDEQKVKFGGWTGWSVNVSRTLTFPDGQKKEERRKVTYSPRARRVEVHPCKIPEGAPGHTGERCPKLEAPDGGAPPSE